MKKLIKNVMLIFTLSLLIYACSENDESAKDVVDDQIIIIDEEVVIEEQVYEFKAGDYNISWEGSPFKTQLTKQSENILTGRFCLNNSITSCEDIGPITITRGDDNNVTIEFSDINCRIDAETPGPFNGTGNITNNNVYNFLISGEDCKREYKDNRVIFSKI